MEFHAKLSKKRKVQRKIRRPYTAGRTRTGRDEPYPKPAGAIARTERLWSHLLSSRAFHRTESSLWSRVFGHTYYRQELLIESFRSHLLLSYGSGRATTVQQRYNNQRHLLLLLTPRMQCTSDDHANFLKMLMPKIQLIWMLPTSLVSATLETPKCEYTFDENAESCNSMQSLAKKKEKDSR